MSVLQSPLAVAYLHGKILCKIIEDNTDENFQKALRSILRSLPSELSDSGYIGVLSMKLYKTWEQSSVLADLYLDLLPSVDLERNKKEDIEKSIENVKTKIINLIQNTADKRTLAESLVTSMLIVALATLNPSCKKCLDIQLSVALRKLLSGKCCKIPERAILLYSEEMKKFVDGIVQVEEGKDNESRDRL
ncbi:hypothetical protein IPA_01625 [Ignicoccus pacificus DSM 13166]|uniref:Uncharacterized protein n=1 Tax=Ignicoccus pacificus DSM 13166 TaxID=940294 RepID=A0A977PJU1_9CREN|nr:hypothetical protein IPA_01625 [Ignicoccus pacificus DSM 13166]